VAEQHNTAETEQPAADEEARDDATVAELQATAERHDARRDARNRWRPTFFWGSFVLFPPLRATLAAPLSHPQYQKNSDTEDQMIKKPLQQPPYPLPSFSPWTKTPSPSPL
jgi:hypothetical protein